MASDPEVVGQLHTAVTRVSRRIDRRVGAGGLTRTEQSALASIAKHGPLGLSELAEVEGINPTMLSRVVSRLEANGLIQRQIDQADRRVVRVAITAAGTRLRRRLLTARSALLSEALASLPDETVASIVAAIPALEALAATLEIRLNARV